MAKYEFYRNDISIEIYSHKESMSTAEVLLEALRVIQMEIIKREQSVNPPKKWDL